MTIAIRLFYRDVKDSYQGVLSFLLFRMLHQAKPAMPLPNSKIRITSYNVCYTKLLRPLASTRFRKLRRSMQSIGRTIYFLRHGVETFV